jgi:hypothetical protein
MSLGDRPHAPHQMIATCHGSATEIIVARHVRALFFTRSSVFSRCQCHTIRLYRLLGLAPRRLPGHSASPSCKRRIQHVVGPLPGLPRVKAAASPMGPSSASSAVYVHDRASSYGPVVMNSRTVHSFGLNDRILELLVDPGGFVIAYIQYRTLHANTDYQKIIDNLLVECTFYVNGAYY